MGEITRPPSSFAAFGYRDFRLYEVARLFLITAGQMLLVGMSWQVYELTRQPLYLGYVGLAEFLPNVLLSLFAGAVADRFDRRGIVMTCVAATACVAGFLAWQAGRPSLAGIYGASALLGVIRAFSAPAGHALVSALIPAELLSGAVVWHIIVFQIATVQGPTVGGLLVSGGVGRLYLVAGALYVMALGAMAVMRVRPGAARSPEPFRSALLGGIRYVFREKRLLGAMSLDLFAVLLGGATALLPVFAKDILDAGPRGFGFLRSAPAVGGGLAALFLAFHPLRRRIGVWMLASVGVFGLTTIAFGLSRSFPLSLALLAVLGAADMISVTVRHTLIQIATPDAMRGRVSAVSMIFINSSNELGEYESGLTAHWFGTVRAVVYGGIGTCVVVLAWSGLFPSLRKADRYEDAPAAPAS